MGLDLISESGDSYRFGGFGWATILGLAQRYGWEPRGTLPPEGWEESEGEPNEPWDGENYGTCDGQLVSAEDAAAIADALEAALADPAVPEVLAAMGAEQREQVERMVPPELAASFAGLPGYDGYRATIVEFAAFCRKGGFRIK
ncbi:MAG TPA: hypothetical protein VG406_00775 [Isosphaeraceae bacterium]|jgi:glycosyltransferase involved in cell wall biosynthesis|nr:hypothetical protein [Isosphaeraceae bacterium]